MVRRLIWWQKARRSPPFPASTKAVVGLSGISTSFEMLSQISRQIIYALLTRAPLNKEQSPYSVRLACVRHAASVRSEPGSNSPVVYWKFRSITQVYCWQNKSHNHLNKCYSVFKDQVTVQPVVRTVVATRRTTYQNRFELSTSFFAARNFFFKKTKNK